MVLAEDRERHRYSVAAGASRAISAAPACFLVNYAIETIYSILLCPILWFGHTIFLTGLLFGREIGWIGQTRDDHAVPFTLALHNLWPHTLLGFADARHVGADAAGSDSLCAVSGGRPGFGDPVCDR